MKLNIIKLKTLHLVKFEHLRNASNSRIYYMYIIIACRKSSTTCYRDGRRPAQGRHHISDFIVDGAVSLCCSWFLFIYKFLMIRTRFESKNNNWKIYFILRKAATVKQQTKVKRVRRAFILIFATLLLCEYLY